MVPDKINDVTNISPEQALYCCIPPCPVAEALCKTFTPRTIGMIGTVIASFGFMLSMFATQIWQLYITFGFLTGFGFGLKFLPSIVCVHEYFEKRQSLAMGIAVCGTGVGTFAFAPLSEYLIEIYGWQGALLIESAIILHGVAFSALFVPLEKKSREKQEDETTLISKLKAAWKTTKEVIAEMMDFRLFKDPKFDVYCVCMFLFAVGYVVPMTYLPERAVKQGYSPREGAWLVSVLGILNMLGRIFVAGVGDRKCVNRFWMFTICILISGVITGGSFLANDIYWLQMTYSGCYGFMIGIFISLESVVLRDLISLENLTKGYGLAIFVGYGIGSLVATSFTGWIFDVTQNYDNSFLVSGGILVASALSMVLIPCLKRYDAKSETPAN
ncbi:monocarboxylate transporter 12-like [Lingula anatina]|uniref:Monocarboxylate transporter 12-like n=1 Tax=Lingula anatina TaxID=7574 RepID=A0A1S3JFU2_LINAN|nr:monocarboxylate transporter 12-like [Lingula anatina]|eukprot:XP_013408764.1 monocarboxylate transporter 12-like [Lingula anatina]